MTNPDVDLLVLTDSSHRSPRLCLPAGLGKTIAPNPDMLASLTSQSRPQHVSFDRSEYQRRTRRRRRRA